MPDNAVSRIRNLVKGGLTSREIAEHLHDGGSRTAKTTVNRIIELRASGATCREIAALLNDERIRTVRGRTWTATNVSNLLINNVGTAKVAALHNNVAG